MPIDSPARDSCASDSIPIPTDAPAIALPGDDDQLRRLMAIPMGAVQPKAISSQGIPVTPQTGGRAIPINRATGQPEELNNEGKPIAPGVAGLWAKSENIHNPFLRGLAKIGSVAARAIDVAGSVAAPGIAAQIPGSTLNQKIGENRAENQQTADTENTERQAVTAHTQAETAAEPTEVAYKQAQTDALNNPQPKPKEEDWSVVPSMVGPNGEIVQQEKNSGQIRLASGVPGVQALKQPNEPDKDKDISDYLSANGLQDNPQNREKARSVIANRGKQEPGSFMPLFDPKTGQITGAWDPKSGRLVSPPSLPGTTTGGANLGNKNGGQAAQDALNYANEYLASKHFTGPGDEALMEKFFELAKPSSGFRMTQAQIEMLQHARDLMGGVVARGKHLFSPDAPYFSDTQRNQIVETMTRLETSKGQGGAAKGPAVGTVEGGYRFKGGNPADKANWEKQ